MFISFFFFFQAEDGIRDVAVTGVQTCALPIFINFPAREINCKLVYYGPGLGGKTANLQWIYDHTDRKSTRLNSSHGYISYAVFCLKKKKQKVIKTKNHLRIVN